MIGTENLEEKLSQVLNDPNSMAQLMSFAPVSYTHLTLPTNSRV